MNIEKFREGLTFDDVLLVPQYSEILPSNVDISTKLTKNLILKTPIISAAMDTVTEADMAIAIAREGGIGIIHKNCSVSDQASMVRKVKRSDSGIIRNPYTLLPVSKIGEAVQLMRNHKIGGIPIVNKNGKLLGVLTNRDMRFVEDMDLPVSQFMTSKNIVWANDGITFEEAKMVLQKSKVEKLPILNNGHLIGLVTYRDLLKMSQFPNASKDSTGSLIVGAAVGVTSDMMTRVESLVEAGVDVVGIDTAHGNSKGVMDAVRNVRKEFNKLQIIGGNIATMDAALGLVDAGVDGVKVGIGPGSICTTRIIAGIGVPQLSAIMDVKRGLIGSDVTLIADGGIRYSGDLVKALAAGADTVMLGSLLAGVEESPGEVIIYGGRKFKQYRGMGSLSAMEAGSKDRYFQEGQDGKKLVPEGVEGMVPYKGSLSENLQQMIGGLRAGMGYCGTSTLEELRRDAEFIRITAASMKESHPHGVSITKEAPNYSQI